jgi:hypothetical protein
LDFTTVIGVFPLFDDPWGVSFMAREDVMTILQSTLTCPECGYQQKEIMPTDACQYFYDCKKCAALLKPKAGDCCVFCSYGDAPCPPVQEDSGCCS